MRLVLLRDDRNYYNDEHDAILSGTVSRHGTKVLFLNRLLACMNIRYLENLDVKEKLVSRFIWT